MRTHSSIKFHPLPLLITVLGVILLAGLWPFNFMPANQVSWMAGRRGLSFDGIGIVYGEWPGNGEPSGATIELVLRPGSEPRHHLPRILAILDPSGDEIISLSQWKTTLEISMGTGMRGKRGRVKDALPGGKNRTLIISMGPAGTDVFVDGVLARSFSDLPFPPAAGASFRRILLGNSPTGKNPWRGEISGLALFDHPLDEGRALQQHRSWTGTSDFIRLREDGPLALYPFNEGGGASAADVLSRQFALRIPSFYQPFKKTILKSPWEMDWFNRSILKDTILNFLGFIPLGLSLFLVLSRIRGPGGPFVYLASILAGGGISLVIELLQGWLPTRTSSPLDLVLNTLGTAAGVFLAHRYLNVANPSADLCVGEVSSKPLNAE